MRIQAIALGLVWTACLYGQRTSRFSWQDYCFNHPAAPFCSGRDYAVKRPDKAKAGREAAAGANVSTDPVSLAPRSVTPSVIVIGAINWRFADPLADGLAGFNVRALSASPLAGDLIAQLGANQGLSEVEIRKIFDGLSGLDQIALSFKDKQIVVMVTGQVQDAALPSPESGLKAVTLLGNAMLVGQPEAVDQAALRIAANGQPPELTRLAEQRRAESDFWAVGSAGFAGPLAVSAEAKRFSLSVSLTKGLASDLAFEFDGVPGADKVGTLRGAPGAVTVEGNLVHIKTSMETEEVQQKFGEFAGGSAGQRLASLVAAARYLPAHDASAQKRSKPLIFGLDGGPKEVNQLPTR